MDSKLTPILPSGLPTSPLTIALLGSFQVTSQAKPLVNFRSNKGRALLAYLVLAQSKPVLRTTLTDLLWPDYTPNSARANLRQVLANLREVLAPHDLLQSDYQTVQLAFDPAVIWCDALVFDELFDASQRHVHPSLAHCPVCQTRLQQTAALYQGAFLENFGNVDSTPFERWRQAQQTHYAARYAAIQTALRPATRPPGNLPQPLTSLIGRTTELSELAGKVLHPVYRCLTLVGPGGMGKTRLAIALGEQMRATFVDGVWFVALAALAPETGEAGDHTHLNDRIATAISTTLRLTLQGALRPAQQLTEYLREKTLLLILDNFEHLRTGVELLVTLLQEAPHVRLVVTSRHRLPLQAQLVYQVTGLPLPPEKAEETLPAAQFIERYASLQLFAERAENALLPLAHDLVNLTTISALCRLLEGSPLGIELAVALLETQSPSEILDAVRAHYSALQANLGDLPQRHRSAYAVLHTTWGQLNAQEAQTLARCSVFRGGFTVVAVQQIVNATATELDALVNKSLLHRADSDMGRYTLHELVRQFSAEQLTHQQAAAQVVHDAHAAYYLALLERWQPGLAAERAFRQTIQGEVANVEAAWDWALAGELVTRLPAALDGLAEFYDLVNAYHAAEAILQRSVAQVRSQLAATPTFSIRHDRLRQLLAALLGKLGYVYVQNLGQSQQARPLAEEGLALAMAIGDGRQTVYSYFLLALVAAFQGDCVQGRALAEKALPLARQHELGREETLTLIVLGLNATGLADYATAINALTQAIALTQQRNDARLEQMVRVTLGSVYLYTGDFAQSIDCFEQVLPLLRQTDAQFQVAYVMMNLGLLRLGLGDYMPAAAAFEVGHQLFTALGEKRLAAGCLALLGWPWLEKGEHDRAIAYGQQALTQAMDDGTQQVAWLMLGDAYLRVSDLAAAQAAYTQAVTISQLPPHMPDRWQAQAGLAAVLLAQNDRAAALAVIDDLLPQFDPTQPDAWRCPQRLLLTAYRVLAANQDPRAPAVLHQAWQLVQEQAEKISDPALRTSYFTNVAVNRTLGLLIATQEK